MKPKKVIKAADASTPPARREPARPAVAPKLGPKSHIIEREVVGARADAAQIIRDAEAEAARLIDEAKEQATEIRQRGFDEGKEEGLAQHTAEIAGALARIQRMETELEPLYIGFVRDCVEKILGQELQQNPAAIVGVVRSALLDARQQREIIVRVHPQDAEALRKNKNRMLEILARANSVEVREDASISRGGCVVVTELGQIDASLERQLEALASALSTELSERGASVPGEDPYAEDGSDDEEYEEYES